MGANSIDAVGTIWQAIAATFLVVLTLRTLSVLREYGADTKTIADASVRQAQYAQTPLLAMSQDSESYFMQNQGLGPAVNIVYSGFNLHVPFTRHLASLAPGGIYRIPRDYYDTFQVNPTEREFVIEYESLSGGRYKTVLKIRTRGRRRDDVLRSLTVKVAVARMMNIRAVLTKWLLPKPKCCLGVIHQPQNPLPGHSEKFRLCPVGHPFL